MDAPVFQGWLGSEHVTSVLVGFGEAAVVPLCEDIASVGSGLALSIMDALAQIGGDAAIEYLVSTATKRQSDALRDRAILGLAQLADPKTVDVLIDCLQHPGGRVQEAVTEALRKIGTPQALAAIGR